MAWLRTLVGGVPSVSGTAPDYVADQAGALEGRFPQMGRQRQPASGSSNAIGFPPVDAAAGRVGFSGGGGGMLQAGKPRALVGGTHSLSSTSAKPENGAAGRVGLLECSGGVPPAEGSGGVVQGEGSGAMAAASAASADSAQVCLIALKTFTLPYPGYKVCEL